MTRPLDCQIAGVGPGHQFQGLCLVLFIGIENIFQIMDETLRHGTEIYFETDYSENDSYVFHREIALSLSSSLISCVLPIDLALTQIFFVAK